MTQSNQSKTNVWFTVTVAALGYFVDIFDIQLFNVVGKNSLGPNGLNLSPEQVNYFYDFVLFNWQMGGMLVGGLVFGIMGDRLGRKSTLFASILIYSLANIANGFVTDTFTYSILRFVAGFGLSGELGAAITLVAELMTKEKRGIGTIMIVAMGALGAVAAAFVSKSFSWQSAYFIGGGLGLLLLLLRFRTFESGMFENLKEQVAGTPAEKRIAQGDFFALFKNTERFTKYIKCILLGVPIWFVLGIVIKFSTKIAEATGVQGKISVADAVMYAYIGLSVGDLMCGWLSQVFRNRRLIIAAFMGASVVITTIMLTWQGMGATTFLAFCFISGIASGYWGLFVTVASEQFGTNLRATVTTTVPNFVRGAVIPITLAYKSYEMNGQTITGAMIVGAVCFLLGLWSIFTLKETFGKDLNYLEVS